MPASPARPTLAVIGAGWAGLAAAIEATRGGHRVTLFEMAGQAGGRARSVPHGELLLDNGQHILIGAYTETLRLMREIGLKEQDVLLRRPLQLIAADGAGLQLRRGPAMPAFVGAVWRRSGWSAGDKGSLLVAAAAWAARRFRCEPALSVAQLTKSLSATVRRDLIEPLCVAALNTPAEQASAEVFLRVLRDALFAGAGAADLLLPRVDLSGVFPRQAMAWLAEAGAQLRLLHRAQNLSANGDGWLVDGEPFDAVVLATPPLEAARLASLIAPAWAAQTSALRYEPIVTVYARSDGTRLPAPMLLLQADVDSPAQFVFDRGQLGGPAGLLAFVVSGARPWVERGAQATEAATLQQAQRELHRDLRSPLQLLRTLTEKRATFACTPGLQRPAGLIATGLWAAGDYVHGPYPATLEGAVRAGVAAARKV